MPRSSVAESRRRHEAIVRRAVEVASVEGLEGVTFGTLAAQLDMSKAGVIAHFPTKEALQRAALDSAVEGFRARVYERAADEQPGLVRLRAWTEAWIDYLTGSELPGGCFLTAASTEWDGRPGSIRDAVVEGLDTWQRVLRRDVRTAAAAGELPEDIDPDQVVFELMGIAVATNQAVQLFNDRRAGARARRAVGRVLGTSRSV